MKGLSLLSRTQLPQPSRRLVQSLQLLAEREPHLPSPIPRIAIETRPRYRRYTNVLDEIVRERYVVGETERANISHNVIRPPWMKTLKPRRRQSRHQMIPPHKVSLSKLLVVLSRQTQRNRPSLLQRRWRTHSQKVVHLA